ncbi:MAG: ABC transporter ATP-binding protein/permease [Lachnospiraceae bacterium]|nr:ABC transporter ATP-binding protein/permease [Lachnospiraceae bacterium]
MKKAVEKIMSTKDIFVIIWFCIRMSLSPSRKECRKYFILNIFISVIIVILPFLLIYLTSSIIGILAGENNGESRHYFVFLCMAVFLVGFCSKVVMSFKFYCDAMYQEILNNHIQILMMEKTANLNVSFFDSPGFYNEMRDASNNVSLIAQTTFQTFDFIKNSVQLIIAIILMSRFSMIFSILLAVSIVPHVIFQRKQLDAMYNFQRTVMGDERKLYYLSEILFSKQYVKDVKHFNLFPFIKSKYTTTWKKIFFTKKKLSFKYTVLVALSNFLPEMIMVALMIQMGIRVLEGNYVISDYSYYFGIAGQLMACMYMIVHNYGQLMDGKARIENYRKFMQWDNTIKDDGSIEFNSEDVIIEFKNVSFRYGEETPLVLNNISFIICTPEKTAIVGANGSGKSTIVKLMMRFYDPTEGEILINGIDIRKYTIKSLRKCFSTMFQDYPSYAFNVHESVSIYDYENMENIDRVNSSLAKGDALQIVSKFSDGINTYLTRQYDEAGVELSGGEWQKISAARTFFREAPVMILDEPSAALDVESEDRLFKQLESEYTNKCAVLISHRLSNVITADRILVLDDGALIERGSHMELVGLNGKYAELFNLQASKYVFPKGKNENVTNRYE